jgi:xylan 1,4-beta-xylosidase
MKILGALFTVSFCLLVLAVLSAQAQTIEVKENPDKQSLKMPWKNCIAVGRADNLLRADLLEHLAYLQKEIGYRYCRFHAIFDDEMQVVIRKPDGAIGYQWHEVDKVYDALLKIGLRPFVELNPMPKALASGSTTMFFYKMNVTPPKSYEEWGNLVEEFAKHVVQRYGLNEVRQWYFEVWNEPDLRGFWTGTKEEYWQLYDASAKALKRVDAKLRIGGPATSKASWIEDFINHGEQTKVPIDFISTHLYPQDEQVFYPDRKGSPHALGNYFSDVIKQTRKKVADSKRPDLEVHWTEWNTLSSKDEKSVAWVNNVHVDNLYAASFIVRNCIELDGAANTLSYWVASDIFDESGMMNSPFSGSYGLVTIQGIPKASCNAFRLLNKMKGDVLLAQPDSTLSPGRGLCVTKEVDTWHIIAWNQNFVEQPTQTDWLGSLKIPVALDKPHLAVSATIGIGAGSPWESWQVMGCPQNLSPAQWELLKAHSQPACDMMKITPASKSISVPFRLKPNEVKYWEIQAMPQTYSQRNVSKEDLDKWEKDMGDKSK